VGRNLHQKGDILVFEDQNKLFLSLKMQLWNCPTHIRTV